MIELLLRDSRPSATTRGHNVGALAIDGNVFRVSLRDGVFNAMDADVVAATARLDGTTHDFHAATSSSP